MKIVRWSRIQGLADTLARMNDFKSDEAIKFNLTMETIYAAINASSAISQYEFTITKSKYGKL